MTSIVWKLTCLSAALGLTACATPKPVDDGAVKQDCQCKCAWTTVDGSEATGTFTFPSQSPPSCNYTAIDNYVDCKDDQGGSHPGTRYYDCQFTGVSPPLP